MMRLHALCLSSPRRLGVGLIVVVGFAVGVLVSSPADSLARELDPEYGWLHDSCRDFETYNSEEHGALICEKDWQVNPTMAIYICPELGYVYKFDCVDCEPGSGSSALMDEDCDCDGDPELQGGGDGCEVDPDF